MNPDDFLVLAKVLGSCAGEAERRTAISRAYYGAFHLACELVRGCGVTLPNKTPDAHEKIPWCLQQSQNAGLAATSAKLSSLRQMRNLADYDLANRTPATAKNVAVQIAIADKIASEIRSSDLIRIRPAIRRYAKDVLGWMLGES
jgi:hypothetical protein